MSQDRRKIRFNATKKIHYKNDPIKKELNKYNDLLSRQLREEQGINKQMTQKMQQLTD